MKKSLRVGCAIALLILLLLLLLRVRCPTVATQLISIGTYNPTGTQEIQAILNTKEFSMIYQTRDKRAFAIRVNEGASQSLLSSAKSKPQLRYIYKITQVKGLDADSRRSANVDGRGDISKITGLSMEAPLFQYDVLLDKISRGEKPMVKLGDYDSLRVISQSAVKSEHSQIILNIEDMNRLPGTLVIGAESNALYAEGQLGGHTISLRKTGNGSPTSPDSLYELVERDRNQIPGDPTPTSIRHSSDRWRALQRDPGVQPHTRLALGVWLTNSAARILSCPQAYASLPDFLSQPGACSVASRENLEKLLAANIANYDKAFSFSGMPTRGIDVHVITADAPWPDSEDARSLISEMCRPSQRSDRSRQMQHESMDQDIDVKALVVWNLCESDHVELTPADLCGASIPPKNDCHSDSVYLADRLNALKLCGLAAKTSANNPDYGAVVMDASCVLNGLIHHEVGHLMGGQHGSFGRPDPNVPPSEARAFMATSPELLKPALTLMASKRECPAEECQWLVRFSSPNPNAAEYVSVAGQVVPERILAGDENHNNDEVVERSFPTVASFGPMRRRFCEYEMPEQQEVFFSFNQPKVFVDEQEIPSERANAKRQLKAWSQRVRAYSETCRTYLMITGHSDSVHGPWKEYNSDLSFTRAKIVADLLQEALGSAVEVCDPIVGYGDGVPFTTNATKEGRARNRRVDVQLSMDKCW